MLPTCFTAAPSTNLSMLSNAVFIPLAIDIFIDGAPSGSKPIIFVLGLNSLTLLIVQWLSRRQWLQKHNR